MSEYEAHLSNEIDAEVRFFWTGQVQLPPLENSRDDGRSTLNASRDTQEDWSSSDQVNYRAEDFLLESSAQNVAFGLFNDPFNAPVATGRYPAWSTSYPVNATYLGGPGGPTTQPVAVGFSPLSTTDSPVRSTNSSDLHPIKPKRKNANAWQVQKLNETYLRTHFPSTQERLQLSATLGMSPRSVQIWFQNKRQSMGHTRQPAPLKRPTHLVRSGDGGDANRATTYNASPYAPGPSTSVSRRRPRQVDQPEQSGNPYTGLRR